MLTVHNISMPQNFTTVIVTQPSRLPYFIEALVNIEEALISFDEMSLLIIFNGRNLLGERALEPIRNRFSKRIRVEVIEINSPMPEVVWQTIESHDLSWIHMPGDDDLIISENYRFFSEELRTRPNLVAVGFSALAIDPHGNKTGKILNPMKASTNDKVELLARAFNRPPFVWPSLMFNLKALPTRRYNSRFVFDWWVGLNLISAGPISTIRKPLVFYRVHDQQESSSASELRKRFEAKIMLEHSLCDLNVQRHLLGHEDRIRFLQKLMRNSPIYGDIFFGGPILLMLMNSIVDLDKKDSISLTNFTSRFAASNGVYLPAYEFPGFRGLKQKRSLQLNFKCELDSNLCYEVRQPLVDSFDPNGPSLGLIKCSHSQKEYKSDGACFLIDCTAGKITKATDVVSQLSNLVGAFSTFSPSPIVTLAPWESKLLVFLRKLLKILRKKSSYFYRLS